MRARVLGNVKMSLMQFDCSFYLETELIVLILIVFFCIVSNFSPDRDHSL